MARNSSDEPEDTDRDLMADRLNHAKPEILRLWVERLRRNVPAADQQERVVLRDHVPSFLDEVVKALASGKAAGTPLSQDDLSNEHGKQRAALDEYSIEEVLLEYGLLRETIFEVLEAEGLLPVFARDVILNSIECAMQKAGAIFMQKRHEDLERVNRRLQHADTRKDEFVFTLAHELRTPLSAISNAAYVLENTQLDDQALRQVSAISRQTRHLSRLVGDLIDVARVASGKVDLQKQVVDICRSAHNAEQSVRPFVDSRGQELTVTLPTEPVLVEADPTRLEQILINLLNNAIRYTHPGGHIWLTVEREAPDAVVRVRDTGVGIKTTMLSKIFTLYTQADPSDPVSHGGLGIGLTLVKSLTALHGGTITASSDGEGKGSEFVVRLPLLTPGPA